MPTKNAKRSRRRSSSRTDRVTLAYRKLRELIVWGRLAPGTRIVESEVAERLGISRTPVRSALLRLQQEGYVLAPEGGKQARLTVAPLTRDDAHELFDIVGGIEGLAARRAAEGDAEARTELGQHLTRINEELLRAAQRDRPNQNDIFDLDTAFHRCYVEAAAGPRLLALHDAIKPQAERYIRLYVSFLVNEISSSVQEHGVTADCIARGDVEGAQHAVETNWRHAAERLNRVIEVVGERGSW